MIIAINAPQVINKPLIVMKSLVYVVSEKSWYKKEVVLVSESWVFGACVVGVGRISWQSEDKTQEYSVLVLPFLTIRKVYKVSFIKH